MIVIARSSKYSVAQHPESRKPFRVLLVRELIAGLWEGHYFPQDDPDPFTSQPQGITLDPHTGDVYDIYPLEQPHESAP